MKLYAHQEVFVNKCLNGMAKHQSVMGVSPTGSGKTVMFNDIIKRLQAKKYRTLVLAHRTELLEQAQEKLWYSHKIPSSIIQGTRKTRYDLPVQIASVATLKNRPMPQDIKVVITDEAHHSKAPTYQFIYSQFPDAYMLGLSATPWRLSGKGFEDNFNHMVEGLSIKELEDKNFLCRAKQFIVPMDRISFDRAVRINTTGDYHDKQLGEYMASDPMVAVTISSWLRYAENKKTVIFASSIEQSLAIVDAFRVKGITAIHVDGKTKKDNRKTILRSFASGKYKVLVNIGIATEGFDVPSIECVLLARPTMSLSLYLQMIGRGSRIYTNGNYTKEHYNLIDISDNILQHGHPNKKQNWSLLDRDKKADKMLIRWFKVLFPDGSMKSMPRHNIPSVPGLKVIEIKRPDRLKDFDKALVFASRSGNNAASAYYNFIRIIQGKPTVNELTYIASKLGYHKKWVTHRANELGL